MADKLEDFLEPGETVVWRHTNAWTYRLRTLGPCALVDGILFTLWMFVLLAEDMSFLWTFLVPFFFSLKGQEGERTLVTDRRILMHRHPKMGELLMDHLIPFEEVEKAEWRRSGYKLSVVLTHDGLERRIEDVGDSEILRRALGEAGRVEKLPPLGPITSFFGYCRALAHTLGVLAFVLVLGFLELDLPNTTMGLITGTLIALGIAACCFWVCRHIAVVLTACLMPQALHWWEARNWLEVETEGGRFDLWTQSFYRDLVAWSYAHHPGPAKPPKSHDGT